MDAVIPLQTTLAPPDADDLGETVRELARGSTDALATLYDRLGSRWFGLALWITGDRDDAADVVQDAVVRIWTRRRRIARATRPEAYLLRVVRSIAVDRVRRRRPTVPVDDLVLPVSSGVEARAEANKLSEHLRRLPEPQRSVLYLRLFVGLSFREIARATRTSTFTAASRYRLGVGKIRRWAAP